MAHRVRMSEVWGSSGAMAPDPRTVAVQIVSPPHDGYLRHDLRQDADAADDVVRDGVARDHSEERHVSEDPGTDAWHQVPRGMDHASAVQGGYGTLRAGVLGGRGRGR